MNGKNCLLCGKALGRIRPGAGADFCSKEHRAQYRLRRSMDCLTEANKVSTLARRRENPKPLVGSVIEGSAAEPRGFFAVRAFGAGRGETAFKPTRISRGSRLAPAGPVRLSGAGGPDVAGRRQYGAPATRARVVERACQWRRWSPGSLAGGAAQPVSPGDRARVGSVVRVSAGAAFRPRSVQWRDRRILSRRASMAGAREGFRKLETAAVAASAVSRLCAAEIGIRFQPSWRGPEIRPARMAWPGAFGMNIRAQAGDLAARPPAVPLVVGGKLAMPAAPRSKAAVSVAAIRVLRLQSVQRTYQPGNAGARLLFRDIGFTGAPDAPARFEWAGSVNGSVPAREHRRR